MSQHRPRFPWLWLRNQAASSRAYELLRDVRRRWLAPQAGWRQNRVDTLDALLGLESDGHWTYCGEGRQRWGDGGAACVNVGPLRLPWWWYRDYAYPALHLMVLHNALAYREDGLAADGRRHRDDDWTPIYGYVWTADGVAVVESMRHDSPDPSATRADLEAIRGRARRLPGTHLHLGWLSGSYGHFLLESLSHAWPLPMLAPQSGLRTTAFAMERDRLEHKVTGEIPEFLRYAFGRFGVDVSSASLICEPVVFDRLLVPTPSFHIRRAAYSTPTQATVWESLPEQSPGRGESAVYLSRKRYRLGSRARRPLANEAEVEALFRAHGFEIAYPETLSFREQMALLGRCAMAAGTVGSNMHNSAFMPRGARVLIIAPTTFVPVADYLINTAKGIRTSYFFTAAGEVGYDSPRPWEVDVRRLEESLKSSGRFT